MASIEQMLQARNTEARNRYASLGVSYPTDDAEE
jgi:hypothetical protein